MPLYNFRCCKCHKRIRKLLTPEQLAELRPPETLTCECGYTAARERSAASSQTMEVLDDGIRVRPVERLADAERIFQERAIQHDLKYGKKESEDE